ncbi:zinc-binding protein [Turicibacter sanguinis]|uniref:zinc-binding protein n=1 Tax=Turicibacter sanguinis TaxID=154288 RepID=UPI0012BCA6B0|nr:zinc-binding protein [Turicibacter sanguinis]MTP79707.1 zinc-binding protein [Turicibacter sanguinis]
MVGKEYERIKKLFDGVDENQLQLVDGVILEAARCKVELDRMHEVIKETGLIQVHPSNAMLQKELPVSKLIVKTRANYLSYINKLSQILGTVVDEDDEDLAGYE